MNEPGSAIKSRLLSRSAVIFAIRFFPVAAMLAVQIAFSHLLPKAQNGIYQQLWMYLSVLATVACFGIPPLLLTHAPRSVHRWLIRLKLRHVVLFHLWVFGLAAALMLLLPADPALGPWMLILLFAAQAWGLLLESYLIINSRFRLLVTQSILYALLFGGVHYLFLRDLLSFKALLQCITGLSLLRVLVLALPAWRQYVAAVAGQKGGQVPGAVRRQWLQLGIYDISQIAFRYIDKMLIALIVGPALFSVYFYGTIEIPFIPVLLGAAGGGLLMQMATGERETATRLRLVNYSGAVLGRIVFPLFYFFFFFRNEFITVVFSDRYAEAVPLFAISIFALPLRAYNYTALLQHLNQVRIINWGAVLDLGVALTLAYPLFLWLGLPGVALAFVLCSYVQAGFYLAHTARLMKCSVWQLIPWRQWLVMLLSFGVAGIALHRGLTGLLSEAGALVWGFVGTLAMIGVALAPVVLKRREG